ncbi:hypothetical protein [Burkholderia multivorans]|uniref:Uncharacterized protein n=1 Tax=Burkholderia multivorans CGD2 TaxID=513052 RepID=B9BX94_9BURK|nr:hypothetical protein [Burkholderia multivorans]EEE04604.1 hypothetical protein BURMUCGD2_2513 [Burkholderia multivorans CGD2]EEE11142.1 hypothetical protein BURMUCGD2M_2600 [Burkholderia multivorans CGD2M]
MPNNNELSEQIRAVCNAHVVTMGDDFALGADRLVRRILALLASHPIQPEPRECRHCGWMCIPNSTPSKTWYPLPQPEPRAEVTDTERLDFLARTGIAIRNEHTSGRWYLQAPYHTKIACVDDFKRFDTFRAAIDAARAGEAS